MQLEGHMASVEAAAPLNRIPTVEHIQRVSSRRARGYYQRVRIYGIDPSGLAISKQITVKVPRLRSRAWVIQQATSILQSGGGRFPQATGSIPIRVVGGIYQATYEAVPEV